MYVALGQALQACLKVECLLNVLRVNVPFCIPRSVKYNSSTTLYHHESNWPKVSHCKMHNLGYNAYQQNTTT